MDEASSEIVVTPWVTSNSEVRFEAPQSSDKSLTHRAIMLAAMAKGVSTIRRPLTGEDCLATRNVFERCGVMFKDSTDHSGGLSWEVSSDGVDQLKSPHETLNLGNSGTSARLLTGLFSGLNGFRVVLTGDDSLRTRPMGRVVEPLRNMGANIESEALGGLLPLTITGESLHPRHLMIETASAQVKSSIILAALSTQGETIIDIRRGGRDHTERMLQSLGASIKLRRLQSRELISVVGPWRPPSFSCEIPVDPSSVAFFAAMAALHPSLTIDVPRVLMNPLRIGFYAKLLTMGVCVDWHEPRTDPCYLGEVVADLSVRRPKTRSLRPFTVHSDEVATLIDEIPVLAVLAAFAEGVSRFEGISELRIKESDRFALTQKLLSSAGVSCSVGDGWLEVHGRGNCPVSDFSFGSDDHRMVMAAMVLGTRTTSAAKIRGVSWINTSFPLFIDAFRNINKVMQE